MEKFVSKIDISTKYHLMCLCMAAAYLNRNPKHFDNVPKIISIFPKVEHEHKHLPLCALPSECTVKKLTWCARPYSAFGLLNEDLKAWYHFTVQIKYNNTGYGVPSKFLCHCKVSRSCCLLWTCMWNYSILNTFQCTSLPFARLTNLMRHE